MFEVSSLTDVTFRDIRTRHRADRAVMKMSCCKCQSEREQLVNLRCSVKPSDRVFMVLENSSECVVNMSTEYSSNPNNICKSFMCESED